MPRFFVAAEAISGEEIHITGEDAKHIKTVLRSKVGEELTVSDGAGWDYSCVIAAFEGKEILCKITGRAKSLSEPKTKITLFQGLPKGDKMELIIQKCVELGVSEIVPVMTKRTVVKLDKKEEKKIERWQKIAEAAAKQSGRGIIPQIGNVLSFPAAVQKASAAGHGLIPYELEQEKGIRDFVGQFQGDTLSIFIGPEGGFDEDEVKMAAEAGIMPVTLGKRILRTETAGMAAAAILLYELG